jgi:hypothetical protein
MKEDRRPTPISNDATWDNPTQDRPQNAVRSQGNRAHLSKKADFLELFLGHLVDGIRSVKNDHSLQREAYHGPRNWREEGYFPSWISSD